MDLPKFMQMLQTRSLWFSRLDQLGDPFEGSHTPNHWPREIERLVEMGFTRSESEEAVAGWREQSPKFRIQNYVNCWHRSEYESAAMWRLYMVGRGIAVVTTFDALRESVETDIDVHIGLVEYVDYRTAIIPYDNAFRSVISKRRSFEHERELRAVFRDTRLIGVPASEHPLGQEVAINLTGLIQEVRVQPESPDWFLSTVQTVAQAAGVTAPVSRSDMDDSPLY